VGDQIRAKSLKKLAERKRFELSKGLPLYTLSRGAPRIGDSRKNGTFMGFQVPSRHAPTPERDGNIRTLSVECIPLTQTSTVTRESLPYGRYGCE